MRKLPFLAAACLPLVAFVPTHADAATHAARTDTARCSVVHVPAPAGARITSVTAQTNPGGTLSFPPSALSGPVTITDVPAFCEITVTVTHPGVHDSVQTKIDLPQQRAAWNGRFQATGGSAYQAGIFGAPLVTGVKDGYATAATDAGIGQSAIDVSAWALDSSGHVNKGLLKNFASRSVHDMATLGKEVVAAFYGNPARFSYWNGCSTGGRQGYEEAQRYPRDFQGILAAAPAVNWDRFAVATLWPQVVFNEENDRPSVCELNAFNTAATKACDEIDGVQDGVIDNPQECHWDPRRLVGTTVECDGKMLTITRTDAEVVRKIWAGPVDERGHTLWYGPNKGADFTYLANSAAQGQFVVADQWVKYFVARDPNLDTRHLTYRQFDRLFRESEQEYGPIIGSDDPNLSSFAKAGGKLVSWQGQADQLVPTLGTVDYRYHVDALMGGTRNVDSFYRLFLLPGVAHCQGGNGPQPVDPLAQLVDWVEQGHAPDALKTSGTRADGSVDSRNVCRFPQVTQYDGSDDPDLASSYHCVA